MPFPILIHFSISNAFVRSPIWLIALFFTTAVSATNVGICSPTSITGFFRNVGNLTARDILPSADEAALYSARVKDAFDAGAWHSEILDPNYTQAPAIFRTAAALYLNQELTQGQLAALGTRWGAQRDLKPIAEGPLKTFAALDAQGKLTPLMVKILSAAVVGKNAFTEWNGPEQFLAFEREVSKLTRVEQFFSAVNIPHYHWNVELLNEHHLIQMSTFSRGGYEFLFEPQGLNSEFGFASDRIAHLIWPPGILQAFLTVTFGNNAVQIKPEARITSIKNLALTMMTGGRSIVIAWPNAGIPKVIDGTETNSVAASEHDFIHAVLGSKIPKAYRMLLARVLYLREQNKEILDEPAFLAAMPNGKYQGLTYIKNGLINLRPESSIFPARAPESFGARLKYDIGEAFSAMIYADLRLDITWYLERNLDPTLLRIELASTNVLALSERWAGN